jgi:nucleoside phosphorylase
MDRRDQTMGNIPATRETQYLQAFAITPRKAAMRTRAINDGPWLVLAAWPPELAHLRVNLPHLPTQVRPRVILACVGVGMVEAGIATARLVQEYSPSAVLLVGTAGAYPGQSAALGLESATIAGRIRLLPHILSGKHAFLPAIVPTEARSAPALVRALRKATGLSCADVACPMGITATTKAATAAAELSCCALENLEAFAVARAAAVAKVPFAAILGIANHVGPRGHRQWEKHAKAAAQCACQAVLAALEDPATGPT